MSIDNNEQPEPTEEYPSHMVEETADEEEITDHQAVADVLTEGQIYPEPVTEERVREVVEEILEENPLMEAVIRNDGLTPEGLVDIGEGAVDITPEEFVSVGRSGINLGLREEVEDEPTEEEQIFPPPSPTPAVHTVQDVRDLTTVDLANIPVGMTAEEYVTHYQTTGVLLTNATTDGQGYIATDGTSTSLDEEMAQTIGRLVDEGSVVVDPENGATVIIGGEEQKPEPSKDETPKQRRARQRKENPDHYKRIASEHLRDKLIRQKLQLSQKTRIMLCDGTVKPNELIITTNGVMFSTSDKTTFNNTNRTQNVIIFDKNFNELTSVQGRSHRFKRVHLKQIGQDHVRANPNVQGGVVVDRDVFMESKGQKLKIIRRRGMTFNDIHHCRKTIVKGFERAEATITWLTAVLRNVFLEEDFDVFYPVSNYNSESMFTILMRFRNIEITNSIEMSHPIGDMIVKMYGTCIPTGEGVRLEIGSSVYGTRMTFDITDAISNYQHSHIPSAMNNFNSFCTGDQYYGSSGRIDEMGFESLLHRLGELVRWESLEGGPHMRMENITLLGNRYNLRKDFTRNDLYTKRMIRIINAKSEKFDVFANCFSIYNDKGTVRFRVDKPRFYSTFTEIIGKDNIRSIHASAGMDLFSYDQSTNTFKMIKSRRVDSPKKMRQQAFNHMKAFQPIYMNGKYHRVILDTTDSEDLINGLNLCPRPDMMDDVANHILFKLTEKLNEHGRKTSK